jgi:hypothetical protein
MKVSDVTVNEIVKYLRLDTGEYTDNELQVLIDASKAYIRSYTGLDDVGIDLHEDITIVLYILCQDMHDTRTMYVEKNYMNKVVETILGMHSTNLLPSTE